MRYGLPAVERAMKMQEIVLRAMSGTITWLQAADILGLSPRTVRRWRARYERQGDGGPLVAGGGAGAKAPPGGPPSAAPGAAGVFRRDAASRWQSSCLAGLDAGGAPDADSRGGRCDHAGARCPARGR